MTMKTNCSKIAAGALLLFSFAVLGRAVAATNEEPSANGGRHLRRESYKYRAYQGRRCRGINGRVSIEQISGLVSRKFCKRECNNSKFCYAFEISRRGVCDLWNEQIDEGELSTDDDRECQVKVGGPEVGALEPPPDWDAEFDRNSDKGCSTVDGDRGSRETGEFDLYKRVSTDECKKNCRLLGLSCTGYEFTTSNGKCEVWREAIASSSDLKHVKGVDCFVKEDSSSTTDTSTTDTSTDTSTSEDVVNNDFGFDAREMGTARDSDGNTWSRSETFARRMWYRKTESGSVSKWKQVDIDANTVYLRGREENEEVKVELDLTLERVWRCTPSRCGEDAEIKWVSAIGTTTPGRVCSADKQVMIYKIRANGKYDGVVKKGEYQLRLNDAKYFPRDTSDCVQDRGYCIWPESRGEYIGDKAEWRFIDISANSDLTVGFRERENGDTEYELVRVKLQKADWYIDTCETYDVRVAADVGVPNPQTSKCFNLSPNLLDEVPDDVVGTVNDCDEWTQPVERFIWYVDVRPAPVSTTRKKRAFRVFNP